jgi:hypothetical protein
MVKAQLQISFLLKVISSGPISTAVGSKQCVVYPPVTLILAFNSRPLRVTDHLNFVTVKV